jgi:hypothetical protein
VGVRLEQSSAASSQRSTADRSHQQAIARPKAATGLASLRKWRGSSGAGFHIRQVADQKISMRQAADRDRD